MEQDNNAKVLSNFGWRFAERVAAQLITLIVSIVLARILSVEEFGIVSLVTIFLTLAQVFVDSGMANALIQKKETDELDFSSVFYFNLVTGVIIYAILFFVSPLIAKFYKDPALTPMMRVLFVTVIVSGVKNIQQAYVSRKLIFKKFFFSTLIGTIISAFIGIGMAMMHFGAWAVIAQQLSNNIIDTTILWFTVRWRPQKKFSMERLKKLFSFGWKLLVSALLNTLYDNLRDLIIGRIYTKSDLSFYNKGKQIPQIVVYNINTSMNSVLLPVMSKEQNNKEAVKNMMRRTIKVSSYVLLPCMLGLIAVAEPLTSFIFTDKWLPMVPYMRIFCFCYALYPIHTANLNAINAIGRSDIFLKLEIAKTAVGLAGLLISIRFGVLAMAYAMVVTDIICTIINAYPNKGLLDYGYMEQLKDILPNVFVSVTMMGVVLALNYLPITGSLIKLLIMLPVGAGVYIILSKLFKLDSFDYLLQVLNRLLRRK